MNLPSDDPRAVRLDRRVRELGLTNEQAISCLFFAMHAYGGERGRQALRQLRAEHAHDERWTFDFDELADLAGVTPSHLLALLETGITEFGERIKRGNREAMQ